MKPASHGDDDEPSAAGDEPRDVDEPSAADEESADEPTPDDEPSSDDPVAGGDDDDDEPAPREDDGADDADELDDDELGRQRRENVRVEVQLPLTIRIGGRETTGRTRDMSATGVGFATREHVELNDRGEVTIEFDDWTFTKAFIVRFVKPILAGHQVGVQFDQLTADERERLVKLVFDVQRKQLQDVRTR